MLFFSEPDLSHEFFLLLIAIVIGLIIGAEREYQNKSAGLRTFILISFGSCIFTILSVKIGISTPDRIASNIITGIGFIGAGVIFKDENKIGGITTAATIWATASLGMCVGSGHIYFALCGAVLVLLVLKALFIFQDFIDHYNKIRVYTLVTNSSQQFENCKTLFKKNQLKAEITGQHFEHTHLTTFWKLTGKAAQHEKFVRELQTGTYVISYQF